MISVKTLIKGKAMKFYEPAFGPFAVDDSDLFDTVEFRSHIDSLRERPGLYGDNHVNHREVHSSLYSSLFGPGYNPRDDISMVKLYNYRTSGSLDTRRYNERYRKYLNPSYGWCYYRYNSTGALERKPSPSRYEVVRFRSRGYANSLTREGAYALVTSVVVYKLLGRSGLGNQEYELATYSAPKRYLSSFKHGTWEADRDLAQQAYSDALSGGPPSSKTKRLVAPWAPLDNKSTDTVVNYRQVKTKVDTLVGLPYSLPKPKSFGDIAVDAVETLDKNTVNMFEFLQGLKRPWEMLPKLKNLNKLRTHAGNYLGYEYGVMPTIDDFKTIVSAITSVSRPFMDPNGFQILTAGSSASSVSYGASVEVTNRVKIAVNPSSPSLHSLSERLRNIGGFPSINNLYELVPYSFVLDWFVDVGGYLERIDADMRMAHLPIMYSTCSSKIVINHMSPESLMDIGLIGDVSIVHYDRNVSREAPRPTLNFEVSNELPSHWLEASALIVARTKY